MVWWDERLSPQAATTISSAKAHLPKLHATVDLDCEYTRELVLEAFQRRPEWLVTCIDRTAVVENSCSHDDDSNDEDQCTPSFNSSLLHWGEYERIDWEQVHTGKQWASCYCVRKGLIRKAHLAHNLRKWVAKHPGGQLAAAVPETLVMEVDDMDYIDEALADVHEVRDMADGSAVWIAKPSVTNQALGICIFDRVATLRSALEDAEGMREWVLQRYIERPLLVGRRKFHIRTYVLCVGSLAVYCYSEALALFAGMPYDRADIGNLASHLTNTCHLKRQAVQRKDSSSCGELKEEEEEKAAVKLLSELPQELADEGMDAEEAAQRVQCATEDMHAILGECLEAVSGELTFFTLPNCFELFGFDLLLDQDWRLWLLEANAEPDLQQTGDRLRGLVAGMVEGTLDLVAGPIEQQQQQQSSCSKRKVEGGYGASFGRWIKVYDKQQEGRGLGGSGMHML